jgi:hypothetical protein
VITGRANVENQTRRLISNIPGRESELASLLVVSEVETVWTEEGKEAESSSAMETVLDDGGEADSFSEWCFEEPVWLTGYHFRYEQSNVKVKVLPPRMSKCVRCWQYTAEDGETPCGRCQTALAEKGIQV